VTASERGADPAALAAEFGVDLAEPPTTSFLHWLAAAGVRPGTDAAAEQAGRFLLACGEEDYNHDDGLMDTVDSQRDPPTAGEAEHQHSAISAAGDADPAGVGEPRSAPTTTEQVAANLAEYDTQLRTEDADAARWDDRAGRQVSDRPGEFDIWAEVVGDDLVLGGQTYPSDEYQYDGEGGVERIPTDAELGRRVALEDHSVMAREAADAEEVGTWVEGPPGEAEYWNLPFRPWADGDLPAPPSAVTNRSGSRADGWIGEVPGAGPVGQLRNLVEAEREAARRAADRVQRVTAEPGDRQQVWPDQQSGRDSEPRHPDRDPGR
jgi:hypothetical protein